MLRRVRVLFSSTGGEGHVQPMLPLARAFRAGGHDVLWAAPPEAERRVTQAGLAFRPAGRGVAWCGAEYARRWPEAQGLPIAEAVAHMYPRLFGDVAASAAIGELDAVFGAFSPELVVHEAAEYAAPALAARHGSPAVAHGIGLGIRPAQVVEACRLSSAPLPAKVLDVCPPSLRPRDIPVPPGALPIQGAVLERYADDALPAELTETLAKAGDRPLVHLTFGTVYAHSEDLRRTATAVAALGVVVAVAGRIGEPVPGVVVADYLPHALLLPRCSAVVSQAGAGVMLKGLVAGLPHVCVPKGVTDQFRNAAALERSGAGLGVVGDDATPEAIAEATRRVLNEQSFSQAARRIAAEIAAMPSPSDVADHLADLAAR